MYPKYKKKNEEMKNIWKTQRQYNNIKKDFMFQYKQIVDILKCN